MDGGSHLATGDKVDPSSTRVVGHRLGSPGNVPAVLRRQIRLMETTGVATSSYQRISLLGRGLGAGTGLVVIVILYLMVFKPAF